MKSLDSSASKKADGKSEGAQTAGDNNGFFTPNSKIDFSNVKIEPLFEEAVDFETFSKSDFRAVKVKECVAVPKSSCYSSLWMTAPAPTAPSSPVSTLTMSRKNWLERHGSPSPTCPPRAMMGIESCGMLLSAVCEENGEEKLNLLMVDNHIPAGAKLY